MFQILEAFGLLLKRDLLQLDLKPNNIMLHFDHTILDPHKENPKIAREVFRNLLND